MGSIMKETREITVDYKTIFDNTFWSRLSALSNVKVLKFEVANSSSPGPATLSKKILTCCPSVLHLTIRYEFSHLLRNYHQENWDNDEEKPCDYYIDLEGQDYEMDFEEMPVDSVWNTMLPIKSLQIQAPLSEYDEVAFIAWRIRFGPNWEHFRKLTFVAWESWYDIENDISVVKEQMKKLRVLEKLMEGKAEARLTKSHLVKSLPL